MSSPLVSVIVPTKNSEAFLEQCLQSIQDQTYPKIELIVIDNHSTDATPTIAKKFTQQVYQKGPERSAQVNYGVTKATGSYIYKVDSDFTLDPEVIEQCVIKTAAGFEAVVVHNTPNEKVSWIARLRKFEVDMYKYDHQHSSPRFIKKSVYTEIGGFNEAITAGEDYDFRNRVDRAGYRTGFIDAEAVHHGEPTNFWQHMRKYYDYGKDMRAYSQANPEFNAEAASFIGVYLKNWRRLLRHPLKTIGLALYTLSKAVFGLSGAAAARFGSSS